MNVVKKKAEKDIYIYCCSFFFDATDTAVTKQQENTIKRKNWNSLHINSTIGALKSKYRKHDENSMGRRVLTRYGGSRCENTAVNQVVNCNLMAQAANHYDKLRPDAKQINHIFREGTIQTGETVMKHTKHS